MVDALGLLGLLLLLVGGGGSAPARRTSSPLPRTAPLPRLPAGAPTPWPQVVPSDLPRFPGGGWEYDEPPPPAVVERARQLVSQLWKDGAGAFKTENTAGRWITYRAEKVRSGKQGVVAYRLKKAAPAPSAAPPLRPPAAPPVAAPQVLTTSPGLPQPPSYTPAAAPMPVDIQIGPAHVPQPQIHMRDLKYGDGLRPAEPIPDVAIVQQKLGINADGRFGRDTQTAVIRFQVQQGLAPNLPIETLRARGFGAVKEATWTKLFAARPGL